MPSLRSLGPTAKPGSSACTTNAEMPLAPLLRVGHRHHRVPARLPRVGDPALGAVEHPGVAVAAGAGAHRGGVGARLALAQRVADHLLARGDRRQDLALQVVGGRQQDRAEPEPVDRRDERRRGADPRHLLDHDHARQLVGALAAVLLGDRDGVEARLDQRLARLGRIATLLVDLGRVRRDLLLRERPHGLAERLVLVAEPVGVEVGVHAASFNGTSCHKTSRLLPSVP